MRGQFRIFAHDFLKGARDVKVGPVFDRSRELLSLLTPMWLVQRLVRRHLLKRRIPYKVFKNLARLTSQWEEENVNAVLFGIEKQAASSLEELMVTIENLLARAESDVPELRSDLRRLSEMEAVTLPKPPDRPPLPQL